MPFSETIKLEARRKADFKCCRCRSIGIDIHHIIPESEGGPSTIENAAPLCQNCHDQFGDNPKKRKELTQMRDSWYEICEKLYSNPQYSQFEERFDKIDQTLNDIQKGSIDLTPLKHLLKELLSKSIDDMTPSSAQYVSSAIVNASTSTSAFKLSDKVYANFICRNCNTSIGLLVGTNKCPNCGHDIYSKD